MVSLLATVVHPVCKMETSSLSDGARMDEEFCASLLQLRVKSRFGRLRHTTVQCMCTDSVEKWEELFGKLLQKFHV